ncbi:MAG: c-type cytochrome [Gammaproteobacteria bacterium]|nr:c-type cytochrome [Gammaproteobacteria bacterium]
MRNTGTQSSPRRIVVVAAAAAGLLAACGESPPPTQVPSFADPALQQGRSTWMQTCRNCHLLGVAGAPAIDDQAAWAARVARGIDRLESNAISGIKRDDAWTMPPRGGNAALSDDEVRRAVRFMLAAVEDLAHNGSRGDN